MKISFKKLLFVVAIFIFIPFITKAGVWEQTSQEDFERGVIEGDIQISDGEIRLIPGVIYENAEDGDTNGWRIFDNDPAGTINNILDPTRRNRIINLTSSDPINSHLTGFDFGFPARSVENLRIVQWKMKTSAMAGIYVVVNTSLGTRSMNYGPYVGTGQSGNYIRHGLGRENADGNWHTFTRNLQDDIRDFEPANTMTNIIYVAVRGSTGIDDIYFIPRDSVYASAILDLGENRVASFNRIIWEEEVPSGTELNLQTRTSADGASWSEWSRKYENNIGERIESAPQRYFQYRANISNNDNITSIPRLRRTLVEYNRIPDRPENLSPINDRRLSNNDSLTWNSASDPDPEDSITYSVELDDNSRFESLDSVTTRVGNTEISLNRLDNFSNLQDGTRYYWRVKTVDSQNNQSDYSSGEKYFVLDKENQAPNPPSSGFNPCQGGTIKTQKPNIYWNAASDPDRTDLAETLSYILQIDENNKFDSANLYTTEKNKTNLIIPENLEDNVKYYYRIKTKDDENAESLWSSVQNFVIATGKNPIISIAKTVGINTDSQSSLLLGFLNYNLIDFNNLKYFLWFALTLAVIFIFLKLNISLIRKYSLTLATARNKEEQQKHFLLFKNTDSLNNSKKVITEVKGSRTKTVIAILIIIGIIALVFAGIYYYEDNPSPYKDDGKNVKVDNTLIYRIDFKNEGELKATNFNIVDNIPKGTIYVENSSTINGDPKTDIKDDDLVTLNSDKIKFQLEEILPKTSGFVTFKVKVESVPENHKIINSADIIFNESDGIQNTNQITNYIEEEVVLKSKIKGIIWNDNDSNKNKDDNEKGIGGIKVKLYEDKNKDDILNAEDNPFIKDINTDSNGKYEFIDISNGNYFVQIEEETLPEGSVITTENNPKLVKIEKAEEYLEINFGIKSTGDDIVIEEETDKPKGKIGDLVWKDNNRNGTKDPNEPGLENVSVKLYEDSNNNRKLEFDQDLYVTLNKTNSNGNYEFSGLSAKDYLVLVEESTIPSGYKLFTKENPVFVKLTSNEQKYDTADFGYNSPEEETATTTTEDEEEVISSIEREYEETPQITTSEKENEPNTVSITPVEVPEEAKKGKIAPPVLTHLGPAQINDYNTKYSIPVNEDLVLKGKAGANFTVTLFIYSELNLKTLTSANQEGLWEMMVNTKLFEAGEHKIYAESQDTEGNLSEKVEIARFKINKEKERGVTYTNYWIVLLGLIIIAATIIIMTWIKEKGKNSNPLKPKSKLKRPIKTTEAPTKKRIKRKIKIT